TPLADVTGPWAARVRQSACRQHLDAVVRWSQAQLRLGYHDIVLSQVLDLVEQYPLVEPLTAVLMRALYAGGRAAEALDCYAQMPMRLTEELGTDPPAELQALHRMILRGDPDPALPRLRPPAATVPAQLPPDVPGFTGRERELAVLDNLLSHAGPPEASGRN